MKTKKNTAPPTADELIQSMFPKEYRDIDKMERY